MLPQTPRGPLEPLTFCSEKHPPELQPATNTVCAHALTVSKRVLDKKGYTPGTWTEEGTTAYAHREGLVHNSYPHSCWGTPPTVSQSKKKSTMQEVVSLPCHEEAVVTRAARRTVCNGT